ncbi:hypothetical protein ABZP36_009648 [Zizania latifolia]
MNSTLKICVTNSVMIDSETMNRSHVRVADQVHRQSNDHVNGSNMTCIEKNIPNAMASSCNQGPTATTDEGSLDSPMTACESQGIIDWSKLVIDVNIDDGDDRDVVLEEDAMYEFIGLRTEDERREARSKESIDNILPPKLEKEINDVSIEIDDNDTEGS